MTHDITPDLPASAKGGPQPPTLEFSDYDGDLAELELTEAQEREVLTYLWDMVKMTVDAGYGLDAASTVLSVIARELFAGMASDASSTTSSTTQEERTTP